MREQRDFFNDWSQMSALLKVFFVSLTVGLIFYCIGWFILSFIMLFIAVGVISYYFVDFFTENAYYIYCWIKNRKRDKDDEQF